MEVYKVVNKRNGKVYIGSSNNPDKRFKQHKQYIIHNTKDNQLDWYDEIRKDNDLGNLILEIIESFDENTPNILVKQREDYWIKYYWDLLGEENVYNSIRGDGSYNRIQMISENNSMNGDFMTKALTTNLLRNNSQLAFNSIESQILSFYKRMDSLGNNYSATIIDLLEKLKSVKGEDFVNNFIIENNINLNYIKDVFKKSQDILENIDSLSTIPIYEDKIFDSVSDLHKHLKSNNIEIGMATLSRCLRGISVPKFDRKYSGISQKLRFLTKEECKERNLIYESLNSRKIHKNSKSSKKFLFDNQIPLIGYQGICDYIKERYKVEITRRKMVNIVLNSDPSLDKIIPNLSKRILEISEEKYFEITGQDLRRKIEIKNNYIYFKYNQFYFKSFKDFQNYIKNSKSLLIPIKLIESKISKNNNTQTKYDYIFKDVELITKEEYDSNYFNQELSEETIITSKENHIEFSDRTSYKLFFDNEKFYGFTGFSNYIFQKFNIKIDRLDLIHKVKENKLSDFDSLIPNFSERFKVKSSGKRGDAK